MPDVPEEQPKDPVAGMTAEQLEKARQLLELSQQHAKLKDQLTGHLNPYKWKKGKSGNPGGRPKNGVARISIRKLLVDILSEEDPSLKDGTTRIEAMLRQAVHLGSRKSFKHLKDVLDRVDEEGAVDDGKTFKVMPVRAPRPAQETADEPRPEQPEQPGPPDAPDGAATP
jgi:hypothetical protein